MMASELVQYVRTFLICYYKYSAFNPMSFIVCIVCAVSVVIPYKSRIHSSDDYYCTQFLKGNAAYLKKIILWMKTIPYPNTIRSHLVTIAPMAPFTPIST